MQSAVRSYWNLKPINKEKNIQKRVSRKKKKTYFQIFIKNYKTKRGIIIILLLVLIFVMSLLEIYLVYLCSKKGGMIKETKKSESPVAPGGIPADPTDLCRGKEADLGNKERHQELLEITEKRKGLKGRILKKIKESGAEFGTYTVPPDKSTAILNQISQAYEKNMVLNEASTADDELERLLVNLFENFVKNEILGAVKKEILDEGGSEKNNINTILDEILDEINIKEFIQNFKDENTELINNINLLLNPSSSSTFGTMNDENYIPNKEPLQEPQNEEQIQEDQNGESQNGESPFREQIQEQEDQKKREMQAFIRRQHTAKECLFGGSNWEKRTVPKQKEQGEEGTVPKQQEEEHPPTYAEFLKKTNSYCPYPGDDDHTSEGGD